MAFDGVKGKPWGRSCCSPEWYFPMLCMAGREQLPGLDAGSSAVSCYSLTKPLSVYHLIFLGGTRNIHCAVNIVLQWMLDLLTCNCAFALETGLCNVSLLPFIAAICLGLCFGFRGDSIDWNTLVNILLNFPLKPWWEQCWTKAVVIIPALCTDYFHYFHTRLKCSIPFLVDQQSTWLTNTSQWEGFHGLHFWELTSGWTELTTCAEGKQNSRNHMSNQVESRSENKKYTSHLSADNTYHFVKLVWCFPVSFVVLCKLGCPQGLKVVDCEISFVPSPACKMPVMHLFTGAGVHGRSHLYHWYLATGSVLVSHGQVLGRLSELCSLSLIAL